MNTGLPDNPTSRSHDCIVLENIGQLLTMTGPELGIREDAKVLVRAGRVEEIGAGRSKTRAPKAPGSDSGSARPPRTIDCRGCVVLPGFVDPHTHPVFGGWRHNEFEQRLAGRSYREIAEAGGGILSSVRQTRQASEEELVASGRERLGEMLDWGTTTVEAKSGYGLDSATELKMLRVIRRLAAEVPQVVLPTFLGAHSVPPDLERGRYVDMVVNEMLPQVAEEKLARFCDVFCENFAFPAAESRRILEAGKAVGLVPRIHADEIESSGGAEVAAEVGALAASHLLRPSDEGLRRMAAAGVIAELLPGTCFFLREQVRPPVKKMRQADIMIALGTDLNPGSSTLAAQPVTVVFACLLYGLSIIEAVRGVTVVAARSLGIEAGTIEPGRRADIVVTDLPDYRHLAYRVAHNPCRTVVCGGRIVRERD